MAQVGPEGRAPEPQRFIVTLRDGAGDPATVANEHAARSGAEISYVYRRALRGFAAVLSDRGLSDLAGDARVARIEPDGPVAASQLTSTTQSSPTWGLDRVDQARGLSKSFTYTSTGRGVSAYIIDTGIRTGHEEFGARATSGYKAAEVGGVADDCNGHGTHVAGTVGGKTYGVAKEVTLVAVKVLDCNGSGTWAGVIAGIDWVTGNRQSTQPAVANMSLGGGANASVDDAVRKSIASGISYAVAAGNGNAGGAAQNACNSSPARVDLAMTIGATDDTDRKASWSNYGNCVDWFAPGVGIASAWHTDNLATNTISGTSMASPHTAGVAALYLQGNPEAPPLVVRDALFAKTTKSVVKLSKSMNTHLLFTSY